MEKERSQKDDSLNEKNKHVFNALTELGNIGAGNAATSLSVLLSSKLLVEPPNVGLYGFNELEHILGGPEVNIVGVLSNVTGDIDAMILFALELEDAELLAKSLMGEDVDWSSFMGMSAISEIANILIGSYVSSLETLTNMKIRYSQPQTCVDMAGAILDVPCSCFGQISDKALVIDSKFVAGDQKLNGYIMLMSEMHSFDTLLERLGIGGVHG